MMLMFAKRPSALKPPCDTNRSASPLLHKYSRSVTLWPERGQKRLLLPLLTVAFLTVAHVAVSQVRPAATTDANAIIKRMLRTYQNAQTLQEQAEAKLTLMGGNSYVQSTTLKFKKPGQFTCESTDPMMGTVTIYCTGQTVTIYSGKQNIFTKRTAATDMTKNLKTLERASSDLLGTELQQILNPLSFIAAKGMPREASQFRYGGLQTIRGRKYHLVTAQADSAWIATLVPTMKITPKQRDIGLWIDAEKNLLVKAVLRITWVATEPGAGGQNAPKTTGGFAFEENHRNTVLNGVFKDTDFQFIPPKDAKEIFQSR